MHTTRIFAAVLTSVGLAAAGLGVGAGPAVAGPSVPHQWCPGDSMYPPAGPGANYVWDMNVCHTWQYTRAGMGNVPNKVPDGYDPITYQPTGWKIQSDSNVWDGPNFPVGAEFDCGTGLFGGSIVC